MKQKKCKICLKPATENDLCKEHNAMYKFEKKLSGYRLRANKGCKEFRHHEKLLINVLKKFYGSKNIVLGYHPLWAVSTKKALLEFDVYIPSKKILIEYNGEQHYYFVPIFHKTKSKFLDQQRRDKRKTKLARKNSFNLIVFKYNEPLFEDYVINKIEQVCGGLNGY